MKSDHLRMNGLGHSSSFTILTSPTIFYPYFLLSLMNNGSTMLLIFLFIPIFPNLTHKLQLTIAYSMLLPEDAIIFSILS